MSPSREAELLSADRFAESFGITLLSASADRLEVALPLAAHHFSEEGRLHTGVAFTIADCAMSLISNATTRAFAVTAHLVVAGDGRPGDELRAVAMPAHRSPGRVTWLVTVSSGDRAVATFTGTTLEVPVS